MSSFKAHALDMNDIDLVIFDWDGTLMDSVAQIVHCLMQTAAEHQLPLTPKQAEGIIGLALPEAMRVLFPNQPNDGYDAIVASYAKYFHASALNPTLNATLFEGVVELFDGLDAKNMSKAIATGKARKGLSRVLAESPLATRFNTTRCADETASKPNPLMLQEILTELNIPVSRALMVGDSTYDLHMAQKIGMRSIGVTYGVHNANELAEFNPVHIVDSVAELQAILLQ